MPAPPPSPSRPLLDPEIAQPHREIRVVPGRAVPRVVKPDDLALVIRVRPVHRHTRRDRDVLAPIARFPMPVRERQAMRARDPRLLLDLGVVGPHGLEAGEVRLVDAARYVLAGEDGAVKLGQGGVELGARVDEVREGLEDDEVGADDGRDLLLGAVVRDELVAGGHVDTVDVRIPAGGACETRDGRGRRGGGTNRIGGAQEAMMTFFAPASRAIWMISFEVVPRTIESRGEWDQLKSCTF